VTYRVEPQALLEDWIAAATSTDDCERRLDWIVAVGEDPYRDAERIPGARGIGRYVRSTPVDDEWAEYAIVDQFHTVRIVRFVGPPRPDLAPRR
jgi:hypothetical protein